MNEIEKDYKITIRLYQNEKYGRYFGKGLVNKVLFTGSIEILRHGKWFIDLTTLDDCAQAFSISSAADLKKIALDMHNDDYSTVPISEILVAQAKRIEKVKGKRQEKFVTGFAFVDTQHQTIEFTIIDEDKNVDVSEKFTYYGCKEDTAKNAPVFFASNFDHSERSAA